MRKILVFLGMSIAVLSYAQDKTNINVFSSASVYSSDFQLMNNLIFVKAKVAKKEGLFMFDTGAYSVFLNEKFYPTEDSEYVATGINGEVEIKGDFWTRVMFSGHKSKRVPAFILDFNFILDPTEDNFHGLIGYKFLRKYEVLIDYANQKINMLDPKSKAVALLHQDCIEIPFEVIGHLPVVSINIGGQIYRMAIDTGSSVNIMDTYHEDVFRKELIREKTLNVTSNSEGLQISQINQIDQCNALGQYFDALPFISSDLSLFNKVLKKPIDGILGYPILKERPFSINYKTKKIYIWDRERFTNNCDEEGADFLSFPTTAQNN